MMKRICLRVNMIEDEKSKRRMMKCIAGIEGVESVAADEREGIITVIGDTDPVYLTVKLRKLGFQPDLLSVGSAKQVNSEAEKGEKEVGSKRDTENRGSNHYLGVQRTVAVGGFGGMNRAIEDNEGSKTRIMEAVGGFGGMNRAIEDNKGSKTRIMEAVAGFGDFTSIEVDIKKGMVTVVGKSVPVSVSLKVREMGYRAKLLSLGPATEEEDPDEEHNDLYPNYPFTTRNDRYPTVVYLYPPANPHPHPHAPSTYLVVAEDNNRCTIA